MRGPRWGSRPVRVKSFQQSMVAKTPTTREAIQEGKYEPATVMSGPGRQPDRTAQPTAAMAPRSPCLFQPTGSLPMPALAVRGPGRGGPALARAEGKRHRGIEQLQLGVHFLKAGAAQLASRCQEIHESAQAETIRPEG